MSKMHTIDLRPYDSVMEKGRPGVEAVEIYAHKNQSFRVKVQSGDVEDFAFSQSGVVSLRADCGQIGYASSEHPDQDPEALLACAVENAASAESEDAPYQRFYAGAERYEALPPVDPALIACGAEQKIAAAMELERLALAQDARIARLESCMLATGLSSTALRNSLGLALASESGHAIAYCAPIAEIGGVAKNGFGYGIARSVEALDLEKIAREAAEDLFAQFGASPVPSGVYDVVLKSDAMIDLLGAFSPVFSAEAAQKGFSLLAGREGESIAAPIVTIADDPMHPKAPFQSAFDAEGVAASRCDVVRGGVFRTLLHNRKTAAKAGVTTTGNAAKTSFSGPIGVAPSNLAILPGDAPREDLIGQMGTGLYITDFSGLHAGVNAVSGSFSLLARGFLVENGAIARPVDQIAVAASFFDLLKQIAAIGDDLHFGLGSFGSPSVLVRALQIAGV